MPNYDSLSLKDATEVVKVGKSRLWTFIAPNGQKQYAATIGLKTITYTDYPTFCNNKFSYDWPEKFSDKAKAEFNQYALANASKKTILLRKGLLVQRKVKGILQTRRVKKSMNVSATRTKDKKYQFLFQHQIFEVYCSMVDSPIESQQLNSESDVSD